MVTMAEDLRTQAEARKFDAQALLAAAQERAADELAHRNRAEAVKFTAEAERAQAESQNLLFNAQILGVNARVLQRSEREDLARDFYHHVYMFSHVVTESSVHDCMDQLTQWMRNDPECEIEIIFSSPGGSLIDGFALWDFIQYVRSKGHHVTTTALGMAASMAGILLQAGDKRVMGRESWLMIHEGSFGAGGKIGDVEDVVEWVKQVHDRILDIFADRSKMTKRALKTKWTRRDWWLSSDQALELGFVDELR